MPCYIVTFEPPNNISAERIRGRLKQLPGYCPIHAYCWAVLTDKNSTMLENWISEGGMANERIFVVRSGTEATWRNSYGDANSEWLKKNL
jgi:hypothetical protein